MGEKEDGDGGEDSDVGEEVWRDGLLECQLCLAVEKQKADRLPPHRGSSL